MPRVYELNVSDFSVIQNAVSPSTRASGIGGNAYIIWHCDFNTDKIYELDSGYDAPSGSTLLGKQNAQGMSIPGGISTGKQNAPGLSIPNGIQIGRS